MADATTGDTKMTEIKTGDFILLTYGRGTQGARVIGETAKRLRIVRCQAYNDAERWSWVLATSMISRSDKRIVGPWTPTPAQVADAPADHDEVQARLELRKAHREIRANLAEARGEIKRELELAHGMDQRDEESLAAWMTERCDCDAGPDAKWFSHRSAGQSMRDASWMRANGRTRGCAAHHAYHDVSEAARAAAQEEMDRRLERLVAEAAAEAPEVTEVQVPVELESKALEAERLERLRERDEEVLESWHHTELQNRITLALVALQEDQSPKRPHELLALAEKLEAILAELGGGDKIEVA